MSRLPEFLHVIYICRSKSVQGLFDFGGLRLCVHPVSGIIECKRQDMQE